MISKCFYFLSRPCGKKGTTISGTVALRLNSFILKKKNTTTNLTAKVMEEAGSTVIYNKEGE